MDTPPPMVPAPTPPPSSGLSEKQWKTFFHLSGLLGLALPMAGNVVGPLILWLIKKDDSATLDTEGRKVLNFQISFLIYLLVAGAIAGALAFLILPLILPVVVWVAWLVLTIVGSVRTSNGVDYRYPYVLKLL